MITWVHEADCLLVAGTAVRLEVDTCSLATRVATAALLGHPPTCQYCHLSVLPVLPTPAAPPHSVVLMPAPAAAPVQHPRLPGRGGRWPLCHLAGQRAASRAQRRVRYLWLTLPGAQGGVQDHGGGAVEPGLVPVWEVAGCVGSVPGSILDCHVPHRVVVVELWSMD